LQIFLNETRLFLKNDLTLPFLAEKTDIPVHHLSQAINTKTNLNFNDYINSFRVNEAKIRLVSSDFDRFTIEAIGRSVGFNNKTTFIGAFKKFENQIPSEYKKRFAPISA
jgi:YesN/AraC family two-component response regulator